MIFAEKPGRLSPERVADMVRKTAKLTGKKTFTFFEEEIPELKDHEILIETISVGLCHSDIPAYFGTSCMGFHRNGYEAMEKEISYPMGLGHEPVGKVIKTGTPEEIKKDTKTTNLRDAFFTLIGGAYNEE